MSRESKKAGYARAVGRGSGETASREHALASGRRRYGKRSRGEHSDTCDGDGFRERRQESIGKLSSVTALPGATLAKFSLNEFPNRIMQ